MLQGRTSAYADIRLVLMCQISIRIITAYCAKNIYRNKTTVVFIGVVVVKVRAAATFANNVVILSILKAAVAAVAVALPTEQNSLFRIKKIRSLKRSLKTSSTVTRSLYTIFMRISVRLRRHALKQ